MEGSLDLWAWAVVAAAFAIGGVVKGLLAFGLPLVMVPPLSLVFPVPTAVALVMLPILLSNAWQMFHAGGLREAFARLWPMIAALLITLLFSTQLLVRLDERLILLIAGAVVLLFALVDLIGFTLVVPPRHERLVGVLVGISGGVVGGITSFFGTPLLMYLHALRIDKDRFVQAAALMLFAGGAVMMATLGKLNVLGREELTLSAFGMVPLMIGLAVGQKWRAKVDQALFRRLVLMGLLAIGASMVARALSG